jgi:hypothetical protein
LYSSPLPVLLLVISAGLKGVLALLDKGFIRDSESIIPDERIFDAVNILISYQNTDGGWATYENNRGWGWFEYLNPSEVRKGHTIRSGACDCSPVWARSPVGRKDRAIGGIVACVGQGARRLPGHRRPDHPSCPVSPPVLMLSSRCSATS